MDDINTFIGKLRNTSVMHDELKKIFKGFQDNIKHISKADAYKIEEIHFQCDDENCHFSFINREYQLVFSSSKDDKNELKGEIVFYRVKSNELKKIDKVAFNSMGFTKEHHDYLDRDGLNLTEVSHCINLFLYWLHKEIY